MFQSRINQRRTRATIKAAILFDLKKLCSSFYRVVSPLHHAQFIPRIGE
jgi:hypothetical protein